MKKILLIVGLFSFIFPSTGNNVGQGSATSVRSRHEDIHITLGDHLQRVLKTYASEVELCEVSDLDTTSFGSIQNICQGLIDSKVCEDVDDKYLIDCNNLMVNQNHVSIPDTTLKSLMRECFRGIIIDGPEEIIVGIWTMIKLAGAYSIDTVGIDAEWSQEMIDYAKSAWGYLMAEADRLEEEGSEWPFLRALVVEPIRDMIDEFSCLNREGQSQLICQSIVEVATYAGSGVMGVAKAGSFVAKKATKLVGKGKLLKTVAATTGGVAGGAAVATGGLVAGPGGALTVVLAPKVIMGIINNVKKVVKKSETKDVSPKSTLEPPTITIPSHMTPTGLVPKSTLKPPTAATALTSTVPSRVTPTGLVPKSTPKPPTASTVPRSATPKAQGSKTIQHQLPHVTDIKKVLKKYDGDSARAAKALGIPEPVLKRQMIKYNIQ